MQLESLAKSVLADSPFAETEVSASLAKQVLTRYGDNQITQNVAQEELEISIRASRHGKTARIKIDQPERAQWQAAYRSLEQTLKILPPGEVAPLWKPQSPVSPGALKTAELPSPETFAQTIRSAIETGRKQGLAASGALRAETSEIAFVNSAGHAIRDSVRDYEFGCTLDGQGGSGMGFSSAEDLKDLDCESAIRRAEEKCLGSRNPGAVEPGEYDVVLEPLAFADQIAYLAWTSLSAKAYVDKRSFCAGKLGERILNEKLSLWDDPAASGGWRFDGQGIEKKRIPIVEIGKLVGLACDLKTSIKTGMPCTGHSVTEPSSHDPVPWNLTAEWSGEELELDQMIASVKRGILVTQLHYTNVVDIMVPSFTGMTRNGTFLIESGKITRPLKNMRYIQSFPELMQNAVAMSRTKTRVPGFFLGGATRMPALLAKNFRFSSATQF